MIPFNEVTVKPIYRWLLMTMEKLFVKWSPGHSFADVMTAELSWHMQNCDLVGSLFFVKAQPVFSHELDCAHKCVYEMAFRVHNTRAINAVTLSYSFDIMWGLSCSIKCSFCLMIIKSNEHPSCITDHLCGESACGFSVQKYMGAIRQKALKAHKTNQNSCCFPLKNNHQIMSVFSICHNSWVVTCAKF